MAGTQKLYPPVINGTIPAFTGTSLSVPFVMNRSVGRSQIKGFALKLKTVQSNTVIISDLFSANYSVDENNGVVTFSLDYPQSSSSSITPYMDTDKLLVGQYYKLQLAYVDTVNSEPGYYSTVGVIKKTADPDVFVDGFQFGAANTSSEYIGVYSQKTPSSGYVETDLVAQQGEDRIYDPTEKEYSYCFTIYNSKNEVFDTSGALLHNSDEDITLYESRDKFICYKEMDDNETYHLVYTVKTMNGLIVDSPRYRIRKMPELASEGSIGLAAALDFENGGIKLTADVVGVDYGTFAITRSSIKDEYGKWDLMKKFAWDGSSDGMFSFIDYTVEQGIEYVYAIQQYNQFGVYSEKYKTEPIKAEFEDMFLYDGEYQLRIEFNPKVSSFKTTILETKTDTIGSKYPFIFRNGAVGYKEFPISGLISYWMDEDHLFAQDEELYFVPPHLHRGNSQVVYPDSRKFYRIHEALKRRTEDGIIEDNANTMVVDAHNATNPDWYVEEPGHTTNLVGYNYTGERIFKLKVLDWLTNGQPKLFRSPAEGNYIVRLLNVSLSPTDTLARLIHTFNSTAYEVDAFDYLSLVSNGFIKVNDDSLFKDRVKYASYRIDEEEKPNDFDMVWVRFENFLPGDTVYFETEEIAALEQALEDFPYDKDALEQQKEKDLNDLSSRISQLEDEIDTIEDTISGINPETPDIDVSQYQNAITDSQSDINEYQNSIDDFNKILNEDDGTSSTNPKGLQDRLKEYQLEINQHNKWVQEKVGSFTEGNPYTQYIIDVNNARIAYENALNKQNIKSNEIKEVEALFANSRFKDLVVSLVQGTYDFPATADNNKTQNLLAAVLGLATVEFNNTTTNAYADLRAYVNAIGTGSSVETINVPAALNQFIGIFQNKDTFIYFVENRIQEIVNQGTEENPITPENNAILKAVELAGIAYFGTNNAVPIEDVQWIIDEAHASELQQILEEYNELNGIDVEALIEQALVLYQNAIEELNKAFANETQEIQDKINELTIEITQILNNIDNYKQLIETAKDAIINYNKLIQKAYTDYVNAKEIYDTLTKKKAELETLLNNKNLLLASLEKQYNDLNNKVIPEKEDLEEYKKLQELLEEKKNEHRYTIGITGELEFRPEVPLHGEPVLEKWQNEEESWPIDLDHRTKSHFIYYAYIDSTPAQIGFESIIGIKIHEVPARQFTAADLDGADLIDVINKGEDIADVHQFENEGRFQFQHFYYLDVEVWDEKYQPYPTSNDNNGWNTDFYRYRGVESKDAAMLRSGVTYSGNENNKMSPNDKYFIVFNNSNYFDVAKPETLHFSSAELAGINSVTIEDNAPLSIVCGYDTLELVRSPNTQYRIIYRSGVEGAEGYVPPQLVKYGEKAKLHPCTFTVEGKKFKGWKDEEYSDEGYPEGATIESLVADGYPFQRDLILTAQWEDA